MESKIKKRYCELFNFKETEGLWGYSLKVVPVKSGYLVIALYERNEYHIEQEDKVLFHKNGKIYRDHKEVKKTN